MQSTEVRWSNGTIGCVTGLEMIEFYKKICNNI